MEVTSTDPLRTRGSALSSAYSPGSVGIHRSPSAQAQPAAPDAVDQPERERDQDWTTYHCTDQREYQYPADERPQQCEPERADLPAVVRSRPGAARVAALHVVQDYGHQRGDTANEAANDGRRTNDADDNGEGM